MKTAMQELFSQLEIEHPNLFNTNTLEGRKFINDYYKFFELEKQQIIDALKEGVNFEINNSHSTQINYNKHFEKYYNETFNK
jgi:hypothetical protein